jgi:glycosyltransferase involved in cell wall biosynthesis
VNEHLDLLGMGTGRLQRVVLDGLPLQVQSAGIAVYTEELVRAMARLRPDVEFVLFGLRPFTRAALRATCVRAERAAWPANVRWLTSAAYPVFMGYPLIGLPRMVPIDRVAGGDVFHATNYASPRAVGARVIVTVHDLALVRFPELGTRPLQRMMRLARRSVAAAHRVIADSESTRRDLVELLGADSDKSRVIFPGCGAAFNPLPAATARACVEARFGFTTPYILHVGTLEPRKNIPALLRAFAQLCRTHPVPHLLVLAGQRGWGYEPIFESVRALDLGGRVQFTGGVRSDDLPALYGAADVFVYPSLYEGFGLPVAEAMACGTPVVASNASSLPEVAGDAAVLVDPHDETALADAVRRVLTDPALRETLRTRGLQQARRFTWERCARETLSVYEDGPDQG